MEMHASRSSALALFKQLGLSVGVCSNKTRLGLWLVRLVNNSVTNLAFLLNRPGLCGQSARYRVWDLSQVPRVGQENEFEQHEVGERGDGYRPYFREAIQGAARMIDSQSIRTALWRTKGTGDCHLDRLCAL